MSLALFKSVIIFVCLFTLLAFAARTLGATQAYRSALAGFTDHCAERVSQCWNGFEPGYTSKDAARAIAENNGYSGFDQRGSFQMQYHAPERDPGCLFVGYSAGGDEGRIASIMLGCTHLSLGDVINYWGLPEQVGYEPFPSRRLYIVYRDSEGRLKAKVALHPFEALSAYATVDFITLAWRRGIPNDVASWHGFAPLWRYCQWEATFAGCA